MNSLKKWFVLRKLQKHIQMHTEEQNEKKKVFVEVSRQKEKILLRQERNMQRRRELEQQYIDALDNAPVKMLEEDLLRVMKDIENDTISVDDLEVQINQIDTAILASEHELALLRSQTNALKVGYNPDKTISSSQAHGRSRVKTHEELGKVQQSEEDFKSSMQSLTPNAGMPDLEALRKVRNEVLKAKAAGKSEEEIEQLKQKN